ncbi:MAG: valine--tRNA ligase [Candidatus Hodarchaeales archaeon]|jgi:valyl-tRNA synthetase
MKTGLPKAYDHNFHEKRIYEWWEKEGYFKPEKMIELGLISKDEPRYCITIPLPNVTGALHLGHAITISIEDLMTRYNRMRQKETLFMPGTDHAGIATQNVVERELLKQGIKRKELGREKFVEKVWEHKDYYHSRITEQSKSMGMSSDWGRERFTLDEQCSRAVREAFYRLYQKGLIYRGKYIVNWCPGRCESAISDLETELHEKQSHLWYIKYPVATDKWKNPTDKWGSGNWAKGANKFVTVATTRPETLVGDTAVATIKSHEKFGKLMGMRAILPVNGRDIPIISDKLVDPEFGTGAVKITPGHDPNDFLIGQRHNLEVISVIDDKARMISEHSGKYVGLDRFECREAIVEDLEKEGLLVKVEPHVHSEPHCQRCHTLIEPRVSIQWFVKTKPIAEAAMEKVHNKETIIIPDREKQRFFHWMENIHDWCISRQLWWGHQIPIWYCDDCGKEICPEPRINEVIECPVCKSSKVKRDPDVLDTWFSSGLWTFSTMGWPNTDHPDYKRFYPTDTRETGYDILFFWVAREMMLGIELTGKTPYKTVYLHGLIRNDKGLKISKSMENIDDYDPLHIIKKHGVDSLRYVLIANSVPGLDMNLDPRQIDAAHRFCNKIWQSTRFVLSHIQENDELLKIDEKIIKDLQHPDRWIISRLNHVVKTVNHHMESYKYLKATREIKNFYWNEFCDWYIEITKIRLYGSDDSAKTVPKAVLLQVLGTCLKLLHPIIPHITEELWQALPEQIKQGPALIVAQWPYHNEQLIDEQLEEEFSLLIVFIREIRRVREDFNVNLNQNIPLQIKVDQEDDFVEKVKETIIRLAKIDQDKLTISTELVAPKRAARIILKSITAYVPLEELVDIEMEKIRISKRLQKVEKQIQQVSNKISGPFSQKAPPEIVEREKNRLEELQSKLSQYNEQLQILQ